MAVIKSRYFILRPFKKGDEAGLIKNINNKIIYRNTSHIPYPYTLKDAREWIGKNSKELKKKKPKQINFVIDINNEVAGAVELDHIEEKHMAEIGYWLGKRYWNKGIMTQAVKLVTKFGFEKLKLRRIYAYIFSFNKSSVRVLEKNGYKSEGILRKNSKKDNKLLDGYLLAKVK